MLITFPLLSIDHANEKLVALRKIPLKLMFTNGITFEIFA